MSLLTVSDPRARVLPLAHCSRALGTPAYILDTHAHAFNTHAYALDIPAYTSHTGRLDAVRILTLSLDHDAHSHAHVLDPHMYALDIHTHIRAYALDTRIRSTHAFAS